MKKKRELLQKYKERRKEGCGKKERRRIDKRSEGKKSKKARKRETRK